MESISEQQRKDIQKEAQVILERFSKSLERVALKKKKEKKEIGGFREEGAGIKSDEDFRSRIFANAPVVAGDYIAAEKKKW